MALTENAKSLPAPWDRIFSLGTRTFVWGLLLAVLYILSQFLLLIFLTFVFAYIQAHGVDGLEHRIRHRTLRVVIVGLVFLGTLFATGFTLAPQVNEQAITFWEDREIYIKQADEELDKFLRKSDAIYEPLQKHQQMTALEKLQATAGSKQEKAEGSNAELLKALRELIDGRRVEQGNAVPTSGDKDEKNGGTEEEKTQNPPEPPKEQQSEEQQEPQPVEPEGQTEPTPPSSEGQDPNAPSAEGEITDPEGNVEGAEDEEEQAPAEPLHLVRDLFEKGMQILRDNPIAIGQSVLGYASAFLLALLFSFLIVLDLPKIKRGIGGLATTKVGFIYTEVADNIAGFAKVLGRALEAQLFIAIVNTILTAIGIWMMGLDNILVLSTIVFFCSFIPVAGTFMSSTPICLIALQTGGVTVMMLAVLLICIIHAIETYVLNPQIYGHHMHMNPVVVLIVLTVGGKLFGIWGLLLGIPVVNYIWRHAIRSPEERAAET